jgi:hypothetical protein
MKFRSRGGLLIALLGGAGCAVPNAGVISPGKYQSKLYPLSLTGGSADQASPASAGLMPPGWRLDNFWGKELPNRPKETESYMTNLEFDWDGDGRFEAQRREFAYLLRFESRLNDGVVWLRGIPVSTDLADMDLSALMTKFSDALSGANYETTRLTRETRTISEEHYASVITASAPCKWAGLECVTAAIDLANVDQLKLDPAHRSRRLRVVIARTPFHYEPSAVSSNGYPVYLFAGYSNLPANFEAGLPDFLSLLQRVSIAGAGGFEAAALTPATPSVPASPVSVSAAPAVPSTTPTAPSE